MKPLILSLSVVFTALVLFLFSSLAYSLPNGNETTVETLENGDVRYTHVTVVIEYGWTDPEKIRNVTALVKYQGHSPVAVVITRKDNSKEDVFIRSDIVVKILDHTGKLIKVVSEMPKAT